MSDSCASSPHFQELCDGVREPFEAFAHLVRGRSSIYEIEHGLRALIRAIVAVVVDLLVELLAERDCALAHLRCPRCGKPMNINRREKLTLQMGECEAGLRRNYVECRDCREYAYPLDGDLGLLEKGECTPQFGHDLCLLAAELPALAGVRLLKALTSREVSEGLIKLQVERDGGALVDLERREAEELWPYTPGGRPRCVRSKGLADLHDPPPPKGTLILLWDGVMANLGNDEAIRREVKEAEQEAERLRDAGEEVKSTLPTHWREVRNARLFRKVDWVEEKSRHGKKRRMILRSEMISAVNDPEFFRRRANALLHVWRADEYPERVLIADGADHLWDLGATLFHPTICILDHRHAVGHLSDCANALWGQGSVEARRWTRRWRRALKKSGPSGLLGELQRLAKQTWPKEPTKILKNLIDYSTKHRAKMDYPRFLRMGLPIGSGAIESANRQVFSDRCKRAGTHWTGAGLQRIVSLRCALLSGNWERACAAIRNHRAGPTVQARCAAADSRIAVTPPSPTRPERLRPEPERRALVPNRKQDALVAAGLLVRATDGRLLPRGANP